jgi:hypothetical protein
VRYGGGSIPGAVFGSTGTATPTAGRGGGAFGSGGGAFGSGGGGGAFGSGGGGGGGGGGATHGRIEFARVTASVCGIGLVAVPSHTMNHRSGVR